MSSNLLSAVAPAPAPTAKSSTLRDPGSADAYRSVADRVDREFGQPERDPFGDRSANLNRDRNNPSETAKAGAAKPGATKPQKKQVDGTDAEQTDEADTDTTIKDSDSEAADLDETAESSDGASENVEELVADVSTDTIVAATTAATDLLAAQVNGSLAATNTDATPTEGELDGEEATPNADADGITAVSTTDTGVDGTGSAANSLSSTGGAAGKEGAAGNDGAAGNGATAANDGAAGNDGASAGAGSQALPNPVATAAAVKTAETAETAVTTADVPSDEVVAAKSAAAPSHAPAQAQPATEVAPSPATAPIIAIADVAPKPQVLSAAQAAPVVAPEATPQELKTNQAQIMNAVRILKGEGGPNRMTLALEPGHLGQVRVELVTRNGLLSVDLTATGRAGMSTISSAMADLRQQLVSDGIQLGELNVGLGGNETPNGGTENESGDRVRANEQRSSQRGTHLNSGPATTTRERSTAGTSGLDLSL